MTWLNFLDGYPCSPEWGGDSGKTFFDGSCGGFPPFPSLLTVMCFALSFWDLKEALPVRAGST